MLKVAICDDEEIICNEIETMLIQYKSLYNTEFEIDIYYSGQNLCHALQESTYYDLLFLDIELKQLDGVKLGKMLRHEFHNNLTQIVYISSKQEYAMELFESRPLDFLLKPFVMSKVFSATTRAFSLCAIQHQCFEFECNHKFYRLPYSEISYFESNNKKVLLFTEKKCYEFYGKLSDVSKTLPTSNFFQIHKSFVINYLHLAEIGSDYVVMSPHQIIPISQTYGTSFRQKLLQRRKESRI